MKVGKGQLQCSVSLVSPRDLALETELRSTVLEYALQTGFSVVAGSVGITAIQNMFLKC